MGWVMGGAVLPACHQSQVKLVASAKF